MSCCFCQHWVPDKNEPRPPWTFENWKRETGECALHPQRKKTTAHYYCSQLRFKDAGLPITWRVDLHHIENEMCQLRDELKRANARKKILNAKVRELRAEGPRADG